MKTIIKKHRKLIVIFTICLAAITLLVFINRPKRSIFTDIKSDITAQEFMQYLDSRHLSYNVQNYSSPNSEQIEKITITDTLKLEDYDMNVEANFGSNGRLSQINARAFTSKLTNPNACGPRNYNYPLFAYLQKICLAEFQKKGTSPGVRCFIINDTKDCLARILAYSAGSTYTEEKKRLETMVIEMTIYSDANDNWEGCEIFSPGYALDDYIDKSAFWQAHRDWDIRNAVYVSFGYYNYTKPEAVERHSDNIYEGKVTKVYFDTLNTTTMTPDKNGESGFENYDETDVKLYTIFEVEVANTYKGDEKAVRKICIEGGINTQVGGQNKVLREAGIDYRVVSTESVPITAGQTYLFTTINSKNGFDGVYSLGQFAFCSDNSNAPGEVDYKMMKEYLEK